MTKRHPILPLSFLAGSCLLASSLFASEMGWKRTLESVTVETTLSMPSEYVKMDVSPSEWLDTAIKDIRAREYHFSASDGNTWSAPNRAQNLRIQVDQNGIMITPRTLDPVPWEVGLRLSAYGRDGSPAKALPVSPIAAGKRIEFRRPALHLTEWYTNDERGLEQGFTIEKPLVNGGPKGDVILAMSILGDIQTRLHPSQESVDVFASTGTSLLSYGGLKVTDSTNRPVPARLTVDGGQLQIRVDDQGASYPLEIDPLILSLEWTAESDQARAKFGTAVSTAGDVNGDGYSDVVIGAPWFDGGQSGEGRVFLYRGSSSGLETEPRWEGEVNSSGARLGAAVAAAGDVNNDGYDDVLVGAPDYFTEPGVSTGLALLFSGQSQDSLTLMWSELGWQHRDEFGFSVAGAGFVNPDPFADILVGAPGEGGEGAVHLYYGSWYGPSTHPNWSYFSMNGRLGHSVSTAGDIDADGYADIVVGEPLYSPNGRALVFNGAALPENDYVALEEDDCDCFGASVSTAGDVNGDGYGDVLVGAPDTYGVADGAGRAYLYTGSSTGVLSDPVWGTGCSQANAHLGHSVATAGDVNGDGLGDVLIGIPDWNATVRDDGIVALYLGSPSFLRANPDWVWSAGQELARLGMSVATAGDVNGDGFSDILAGAPYYDAPEIDEGRVFAFLGSAEALTDGGPDWLAFGANSWGGCGLSVANAGDLNGDGFDDILVGEPTWMLGSLPYGRISAYFGGPSGLFPDPMYFLPSQSWSWFGFSVAPAGDVNGDGYGDVLVGAPYYDGSLSDEGRVFLYLGSPSYPFLVENTAWVPHGGHADAHFGYSVAGAGDVNADGFADLLVGAPDYDGGTGQAYLYLGSTENPTLAAGWPVEGDQAGARVGLSVGAAGDVNRDGYSDIMVGAPLYDGGAETDNGAVFLYFGLFTGPDTTADWQAEGDLSDAGFGSSVATAGDVNGDGFGDILIGAPNYDGVEPNTGRAYLFEGSASGPEEDPAWHVEGSQADAAVGFSVATAGDINLDGFTDILIGAPLADDTTTDGGLVWVFLGSAEGLGLSPIWGRAGIREACQFGYSVSTAGDVNGDGFSDVLFGAPYWSETLLAQGAAFLFLGNARDGLDRRLQQIRSDGTAPIALLGKADSETSFRIKVLGRTPLGRGCVSLQWEVKPLGTPFDGLTGLGYSSWYWTGDPIPNQGSTVAFDELVSGLNSGTSYHWRARLRYSSHPPFVSTSPWFSMQGNGPEEADLYTAGALASVEPELPQTKPSLRLSVPRPSPFRFSTRLEYQIEQTAAAELVRIRVLDATGRVLRTLFEGHQSPGPHVITWDGQDDRGRPVANGVYFLQLHNGSNRLQRRVAVVR